MEIMAHYVVQGPGQPGDLGAVGCSFPLQMKTCHFDFEKKKKNIRISTSSRSVAGCPTCVLKKIMSRQILQADSKKKNCKYQFYML